MNSHVGRRVLCTIVAGSLALLSDPRTAFAGGDRPGGSSPSGQPAPANPTKDTSEPTAAAKEEALTHYRQGVALYNEGDYKLALIELQRAYELNPSWKLLYNIGNVHYQLNNYAAALKALQSYLDLGGSEVPAQRRTELAKDIDALKGRVAHVTVNVNVPGAEVHFGDTLVGTSPVDPGQLVDAGALKISVTKNGYQSFTRTITLAGRDDTSVNVTLEPIKGKTDVLIVRDESRSYAWLIGWIGTGVLTTGAVVTGIIAMGAADDLEQAKTQRGVSASTLSDLDSRRSTFALASDILAVSAVLAGSVSTYLTIKEVTRGPSKAPSKDAPKGAFVPRFDVGLGSASFSASF